MQLESAGIQYFNMKAKFLDEHRVLVSLRFNNKFLLAN